VLAWGLNNYGQLGIQQEGDTAEDRYDRTKRQSERVRARGSEREGESESFSTGSGIATPAPDNHVPSFEQRFFCAALRDDAGWQAGQ